MLEMKEFVMEFIEFVNSDVCWDMVDEMEEWWRTSVRSRCDV